MNEGQMSDSLIARARKVARDMDCPCMQAETRPGPRGPNGHDVDCPAVVIAALCDALEEAQRLQRHGEGQMR